MSLIPPLDIQVPPPPGNDEKLLPWNCHCYSTIQTSYQFTDSHKQISVHVELGQCELDGSRTGIKPAIMVCALIIDHQYYFHYRFLAFICQIAGVDCVQRYSETDLDISHGKRTQGNGGLRLYPTSSQSYHMINVYIYLEPQICIVRLILNVRHMTQSSVFKFLSMLSHNSLRPTFMELKIFTFCSYLLI